MTRRDSLQRIALLLGGIALAPELLANALAAPPPFSPPERKRLLEEMAETIIPTTDTPGAKAAGVADFIAHAVEFCFPKARQERFWGELNNADAACMKQTGKSFVDCSEAERIAFFKQLDSRKRSERSEDNSTPFFTTLKMLVLHGYFTSEIGASQALNYDPVPGGWTADMIIEPDTKAWTPVF